MDGVITKGYGGFYVVQTEKGRYTCSLRGRLRHRKKDLSGDLRIMVGDRVCITELAPDEGVVEEIYPRAHQLYRPRIANVTQGVVVMSVKNPEPDLLLLDRLLLLIRQAGLQPVICFNKSDLLDNTEKFTPAAVYRQAGFPVYLISAFLGGGRTELLNALQGQISVLAGPSGAGKSTSLNMLEPGLDLVTGQVSEKLQRGRHTTRYVELYRLSGSDAFVADSPGFSRLELPEELNAQNLASFYPEMAACQAACRFDGCLHHNEPDCAVKEKVADGRIDEGRYQRYLILLEELREREERLYD